MPSMAERQLRLYEQIRRAQAFGYPVALALLSWDAAKGKKRVRLFADKLWHVDYVPLSEEQLIAAIKGGANAYLMRTVELGVSVRDADSPEAVAKIEALQPRHVVTTPRGGLHAYYRGERYRTDTAGEDTMMAAVFGPGSFYSRYGSVTEYGGEVPDPAALDPLPAVLAQDMAAQRTRAAVGQRQIKAQSAAAREFERLRAELLKALSEGKRGLWDYATMLNLAAHLVRLCGPEVGPRVWDDAFAAVGLSQDDSDRKHIDSAVEKFGNSSDDVRPDDQLPPEIRFWAGGRHAGEQLPGAAPGSVNLPDDFWRAREGLKHIRDAAHARARSADAVLLSVLARLSSMVPATVRIDTGVGVPASLNLFVVLMGTSATGKSTAARLADGLFHTEGLISADESSVFAAARPVGSGEGLADEYLGTVEDIDPRTGKIVKQRKQVRAHAMFSADEGAALLEAGQRPGSTLLPTIRQAWTGAPFGQKNASVERDRYVADYAMGLWIGLQPSHAARLLSAQSVDEGTLQRFVWASATDPSIGEEPPPDPGPLHWDVNIVNQTVLGTSMGFPESIKTELRIQHVRVGRGELVPETGREHESLQRVKVSGLLAILDGRAEVTLSDWALAGMVLDTSAAVVGTVRASAARRSAETETAYIAKRVRQDDALAEAVEARLMRAEVAVRESALRRVADKPGQLTPGQLAKMERGPRRDLARDEIESLLALGHLVLHDGRLHPGTAT